MERETHSISISTYAHYQICNFLMTFKMMSISVHSSGKSHVRVGRTFE